MALRTYQVGGSQQRHHTMPPHLSSPPIFSNEGRSSLEKHIDDSCREKVLEENSCLPDAMLLGKRVREGENSQVQCNDTGADSEAICVPRKGRNDDQSKTSDVDLKSSDESMKQSGSSNDSGVSQATEGINSSRPVKRARLVDSSHREATQRAAVRRSKRPYSPAVQFVRVSDAARSVQLFEVNPSHAVAPRSCTTISERNHPHANGLSSTDRSGGDHCSVQRLRSDPRFPRPSARNIFGVHRNVNRSARSVFASSARTPFHRSSQTLANNRQFLAIAQQRHVRRRPTIPPFPSNRVVARQPISTTIMLRREQEQTNANLIAAFDEYLSRAGHDLWHVPPPS